MHPETLNNLSLLDVAAGHFSLLEYKSGGFVPASLLTEFAHIARQYIKDYGRNQPQHQQQEEAEMQEREDEEKGAEPCGIGSSNVESTLAFEASLEYRDFILVSFLILARILSSWLKRTTPAVSMMSACKMTLWSFGNQVTIFTTL